MGFVPARPAWISRINEICTELDEFNHAEWSWLFFQGYVQTVANHTQYQVVNAYMLELTHDTTGAIIVSFRPFRPL